MKNFSISRLIAESLPVAAFDTIYFLLVEDFSTSRWIGWSCLHVAYLVLVLSGRQTSSKGTSAVFGFPRIAASWSLLVMVFVAFVMIFLVNPESAKWPTIIEVVATVSYLCLYFVINYAESSACEADAGFKRNLMFVKECSESLLAAKGCVNDTGCRKNIEKAYDAIRNGNVSSVPAAREVESEISRIVDDICELADSGSGNDRIKELSKTIVRNMAKRENIIRNNR